MSAFSFSVCKRLVWSGQNPVPNTQNPINPVIGVVRVTIEPVCILKKWKLSRGHPPPCSCPLFPNLMKDYFSAKNPFFVFEMWNNRGTHLSHKQRPSDVRLCHAVLPAYCKKRPLLSFYLPPDFLAPMNEDALPCTSSFMAYLNKYFISSALWTVFFREETRHSIAGSVYALPLISLTQNQCEKKPYWIKRQAK